MLSEDIFKKNYIGANLAKGIEVNKDTLPFIFKAIKSRFTDEQFILITGDVTAEAIAYGKQLDIAEWTRRLMRLESFDKGQKKAEFVGGILGWASGYFPDEGTVKFINDNLPLREREALRQAGGIQYLWRQCRDKGVYNPENDKWVEKALSEAYDTVADVPPALMIASERNEENVKKIENLLSKSIQKVAG